MLSCSGQQVFQVLMTHLHRGGHSLESPAPKRDGCNEPSEGDTREVSAEADRSCANIWVEPSTPCKLESSMDTSASVHVEDPQSSVSTCTVETELHRYLAPWGLDVYAEPLETHGFDVEVLRMLDAKSRDDMFALIACKPGHQVRFRMLLEGRPPPKAAPSSAR